MDSNHHDKGDAPSPTARSSHRTDDLSPGPPSAVAGRYAATRQVLAGAGQIERTICDLRAYLEADGDDDAARRTALLQTWIAVERCLSDDEHRQLRGAVLKRLFPHSAPAELSRGGGATGGGHCS
jgi:hypothetical protein